MTYLKLLSPFKYFSFINLRLRGKRTQAYVPKQISTKIDVEIPN